MRYRKLSATGDYTFGNGAANYFVNVPEAVGQAVETRLLLWLGEFFLDVTDGTPYVTEILGTHTQLTYDLAIKTRILNTPGVTQITAYQSSVTDRALTVTATIDTVYGTTDISVTSITPVSS